LKQKLFSFIFSIRSANILFVFLFIDVILTTNIIQESISWQIWFCGSFYLTKMSYFIELILSVKFGSRFMLKHHEWVSWEPKKKFSQKSLVLMLSFYGVWRFLVETKDWLLLIKLMSLKNEHVIHSFECIKIWNNYLRQN